MRRCREEVPWGGPSQPPLLALFSLPVLTLLVIALSLTPPLNPTVGGTQGHFAAAEAAESGGSQPPLLPHSRLPRRTASRAASHRDSPARKGLDG